MKTNMTPKTIDYDNKILEVKNLRTYFKVGSGKNKLKVKAVNDISFDVYKREVFGLVGESGCGKTTASRTIIRLYRPTGGEVKFESKIIGSGHNEFYSNLKYEQANYRVEQIKLNSRKKAVYEIKEKYQKLFADLKLEEKKINAKFSDQKAQIETSIEGYKKLVFDEKNNYNLTKEKAKYDFYIEKSQFYNETINEQLLEYTGIKKRLARRLKTKLLALDDSVGLSKTSREQQKTLLKSKYEDELITLEAEYRDKISEKSEHLLPQSDYKVKVNQLAQTYKEIVSANERRHVEYLKSLQAPNYSAIRAELAKLNVSLKQSLQDIKMRKKLLKQQRQTELKSVDKKAHIDHEKLAQLKLDHQKFVEKQRAGIKASREKHFTKNAVEQTKRMQMIFQDPISSLNPRMTVGEIVAEGLVINGEKDKEVLKEKVIEALKLVGLAPEYISRYPHEFSGGQRQRIGIARALIMDPSFIIADEPISALDVSIRAQVLNLLTELKEKLDLSILFIAHDLSVVKFFCDRIAVMYAGKIVELSSNEEIFKRPLHAYTKSLLSAIPQPDPNTEKKRKRIAYSPAMHDYSIDQPELREVYAGHFVYCNEKEYESIKKELGGVNA